MIMSSKYPTTASNSASEAEELKNTPGLGAISNNSFKKKMDIFKYAQKKKE